MDTLINTQLGRYRLLERIGEGGMGAVYRALDTRLDCDVAVKLLLPGRESGEVFLKRFQREAKAMARLNHPNLVKVTDYGEEDGKYYLVMPYISGGTLADLPKPMAAENAARYLIPVARALGYAHSQGMIHRDVKPSNILLTQSDEPMLSDFGIARLVGDQEATAITKTGLGVGTPAYMAPEQIKKGYDHRVDIYSLGVVLYELVTGQQPFKGDTPLDTLFKHATEPLVPPGEVLASIPQDVEDIIVRALVKDPDQRYQTMEAFARALQGVIPVIPEVSEVEEHEVEAVGEEEPEPVVKVDEAETSDELEIPAKELQPLPKEPEKKRPVEEKAKPVVSTRKKEALARRGALLRKRWWQFGLGGLVMIGLVWGIAVGLSGDELVFNEDRSAGEQTTQETIAYSVKPSQTEITTPKVTATQGPTFTATPNPTPISTSTITPTQTNTSFPTSIPQEIVIFSKVGGKRFVAEEGGTYRFTIMSGAIQNCPVGADPKNPNCATWDTKLLIYKNRSIVWTPNASNEDFSVGLHSYSKTQSEAEELGKGKFVDIELNEGEYVMIVAFDCQTCYRDNLGNMKLNVSLVAPPATSTVDPSILE